MNSQELGLYGEKLAARYLQFYGYDILDTRYAGSQGELDIIARNEEALAFIEVKTRSSYLSGHGVDMMTPAKLKRMQFVAHEWMLARDAKTSLELRYDLIAILVDEIKAPLLEHFEAVTV
ncbi:MAG: YraN family protein [Micrococcaceae bacterium]